MKCIKSTTAHLQIVRPFRKLWTPTYVYLLQCEASERLIVSRNQIKDIENGINTQKWHEYDIKLDKTIDSLNSIKKLGKDELSYSKCPSNHAFILDFGRTSKYKLAFENPEEYTNWIATITQKINDYKCIAKPAEKDSFADIVLKKLGFKKSSNDNKENSGINISITSKVSPCSFFVYKITTDPPTEEFNNLYRSSIEFNSSQIKLNFTQADNVIKKISWQYTDVRRYGISPNMFCLEVMDHHSSQSSSIEFISYFLTVDKEENLKRAFESFAANLSKNSSVSTGNVNDVDSQISDSKRSVKSDCDIFLHSSGDTLNSDAKREPTVVRQPTIYQSLDETTTRNSSPETIVTSSVVKSDSLLLKTEIIYAPYPDYKSAPVELWYIEHQNSSIDHDTKNSLFENAINTTETNPIIPRKKICSTPFYNSVSDRHHNVKDIAKYFESLSKKTTSPESAPKFDPADVTTEIFNNATPPRRVVVSHLDSPIEFNQNA